MQGVDGLDSPPIVVGNEAQASNTREDKTMLTMWRPERDLARWHRNPSAFFAGPDAAGATFAPAVDVAELDDRFVLSADLPGMKQEDIQIRVDDGVLVLSGSRKSEHSEEGKGYTMSERSYGKFSRSFRLGRHIDNEGIKADYKDGVLRVELPKSKEVQPRQIQVSVH